MAGIKRKDGPKAAAVNPSPVQKKQKVAKQSKPAKPAEDLIESDTTEDDENDFGGFGDDDEGADAGGSSMSDVEEDSAAVKKPKNTNMARDGDKFKRESMHVRRSPHTTNTV